MPETTRSEPSPIPAARRDSRRRRTHPRRLPGGLREVRPTEPAGPTLTIAKPDSPVKWDIADDNKPIADGLAPEKGATLKIYNYADYLSPQAVKAFEDQYGCKVEISTFNDGDEAITKLRSGVDFDIYNANYTEISRLVTGGLLRPLNHSYIPNISNVWPTFTNPWYDQGWQYTVPYTIYTTGMGWRTDQVPADIGALSNPVRITVGHRRTRTRRRSSTTGTPRWRWCC